MSGRMLNVVACRRACVVLQCPAICTPAGWMPDDAISVHAMSLGSLRTGSCMVQGWCTFPVLLHSTKPTGQQQTSTSTKTAIYPAQSVSVYGKLKLKCTRTSARSEPSGRPPSSVTAASTMSLNAGSWSCACSRGTSASMEPGPSSCPWNTLRRAAGGGG